MRVYIRLRVINLMFSSAYTKDWYVFTFLYEVWNTRNSNCKHCAYIFWFCNSFVGAWYVTHWIVDIPFHQAWERFSIYILTRLLFGSSPEKSLLLQEDGIQLKEMKHQSSGWIVHFWRPWALPAQLQFSIFDKSECPHKIAT